MSNLKYIITTVLFLVISNGLLAQCFITPRVIQDPNDPCCAILQVRFDQGCNFTTVDEIQADFMALAGSGARIVSWSPILSGTTGSISGGGQFLTLNNSNFVDPVQLGSFIDIALMCFTDIENQSQFGVIAEFEFYDGMNIISTRGNEFSLTGCANTAPLECDFIFSTQGCFEGLFAAQITGGTPPYTVTYDINCDNSIEINGTNGSFTFPIPLNSQSYQVCMNIVDADGVSCDIMKTIVIEDTEPPVINCPDDLFEFASICDAGIPVTYPPATASDICSQVNITYSHLSGSIFPCGTTTVTVIATDQSGNSSTCTFNVNVDCTCGTVEFPRAECSDSMNIQTFSGNIYIDPSISNPESICNINLVVPQSNAIIQNVNYNWFGNGVQIDGEIKIISPCPGFTKVDIVAELDCICPSGDPFECDIPFSIDLDCCIELGIEDLFTCKDAINVAVPIIGCDQLCDVTRVNWYVADSPCDPSDFELFQTTNNCDPLIIDPKYHSKDLCVYAEVTVGNQDSCPGLYRTDTAKITICEPVQVSMGNQVYCYTGSPVTPTLFAPTIIDPKACGYDIRWYDDNGLIPGETGPTYQPPAISIPTGNKDCNKVYTYSIEIDGPCGVSQSSATIQLDNSDADNGSLSLDPVEPLPLCPGEDASLRYDKACVEPSNDWDWYMSQDNSTYIQMPEAGNRNPLYNTNRLWQDTWYKVKKVNGSCPEDSLTLFIPVRDNMTVTNFRAGHSPICDPTSVKLIVDIAPQLTGSCNYNIDWYKDGVKLHSSQSQGGTVAWSYIPTSDADFEGNYYVIVTSACCGTTILSSVDFVDAPMSLKVICPCFRCKDDTVTVQSIIYNQVPGASYSFQWYDNSVPVPGATSPVLTVDPTMDGPFELIMKANINGVVCVYQDMCELKQCGSTTILKEYQFVDLNVFPNPSNGNLILKFKERLKSEITIELMNISGKTVYMDRMSRGITQQKLDLRSIDSGIFIMRINDMEKTLYIGKIIKY